MNETTARRARPARLEGRTCVIAGAGGAIGTAVAARFEGEGAQVIGIDRQPVDAAFPVFTADLRIDSGRSRRAA